MQFVTYNIQYSKGRDSRRSGGRVPLSEDRADPFQEGRRLLGVDPVAGLGNAVDLGLRKEVADARVVGLPGYSMSKGCPLTERPRLAVSGATMEPAMRA